MEDETSITDVGGVTRMSKTGGQQDGKGLRTDPTCPEGWPSQCSALSHSLPSGFKPSPFRGRRLSAMLASKSRVGRAQMVVLMTAGGQALLCHSTEVLKVIIQ